MFIRVRCVDAVNLFLINLLCKILPKNIRFRQAQLTFQMIQILIRGTWMTFAVQWKCLSRKLKLAAFVRCASLQFTQSSWYWCPWSVARVHGRPFTWSMRIPIVICITALPLGTHVHSHIQPFPVDRMTKPQLRMHRHLLPANRKCSSHPSIVRHELSYENISESQQFHRNNQCERAIEPEDNDQKWFAYDCADVCHWGDLLRITRPFSSHLCSSYEFGIVFHNDVIGCATYDR